MTPEQKELFHLAILRVMDANRTRFGLGIKAIGLHLTPQGFMPASLGGVDAFDALVTEGVEYLADHQLVEEVAKTIDRANRAWKITSAGIEMVDIRG